MRCRWREEQVNDPEYAAAVVAAFPTHGDEAPPDWRSWSGESELLAKVVDALSQLIKDRDPKHRKVRTVKRPVTEIYRAYETAEAAGDDAFEADIFATLGIDSAV